MSAPRSERLPLYLGSGSLIVLLVLSCTLGYLYIQTERQLVSLQARLDNVQSRLELLGKGNEEGIGPYQIYVRIEESVVQVLNQKMGEKGLEPSARGTGFTYDTDGHIITNNHVVEGADAVEVNFRDGTTFKASIAGTDVYSDLAVLKVSTSTGKLKPVVLGNSSKLLVGESIYAVGAPFGLGWSLTRGIVSQIGRSLPATAGYLIPGEIQIDAAINPGNSGGPLLNSLGEVVGVNSAIQSETGVFSGVGFAIPSNLVKRVVPALIQSGRYDHPWLGVAGTDMTSSIAERMNIPETQGFLVMSVVENGPAQKAGIRMGNKTEVIDGGNITVGGDIITHIDGKPVKKLEDLLNDLEYYKKPGDTVKLSIIRQGNNIELEANLGVRPAATTNK